MPRQLIPRPTLQRLSAYLNYLRSLPPDTRSISATAVAAALGLNEVQVRKDLSAASKSGGRPKTGYTVGVLIRELEEFLGYTSIKNAVLVGVGRLGGAMLAFTGFEERGVHIIAAFDNDPAKIGTEIGDCGGSDRHLSPPPILASPLPPSKWWRSSSNQSFCLGLAGFCLGLSCGSCCLGLETVRVDIDFEWSCCLGLEIERVVLVGNEWENSGSSMKE